MREIDNTKPVLVTGGTGYVASWIIKKLLEQGVDVHTTVRDPANFKLVAPLNAMANSLPGKLTLFQANLLQRGSYDQAMRGCELVIHTASPFFLTKAKNPQDELIRPAQEGTRNVLESVNRISTVKRVVLTSSVAATYGDIADCASHPTGVLTENDWNTTSNTAHQPYSYSKTLAEKVAWEIADKQQRWDLVVINPGWVLGPSLSKRNDSASINAMIQFGDGTYKAGVPALNTPIVDVRDVAAAHIKAGFTPQARGRHILVSGVESLLGISNIIRKYHGDTYPLARKEVPKFLFWLMAPILGFTRKWVSQNVGFTIRFDNDYSKKNLGMSYLPIEQTIRDHFQQLLDDGLLNKA